MTSTATTVTPRLSNLNPSKSRIYSSFSFSSSNNKRSSNTPLSSSEVHYILEGCRDNCRLDGRSRDELRSYTLLQNAPLVLSNGSCRMLMGGGATHVVCSCKAELVQPCALYPHQGVVELHVDLLGNQRREEEQVLQSTLSKLLLKSVVNLEKLCVVPHYYVWRLNVDVLVLSGSGGSLVDVCSRVIRGALQTTQLAHVSPTQSHSQGNNTATNATGAQVDLQVNGDIQNAVPVPGVDKCPIVVTVLVCKCPPKYTTVLVVDGTLQEEACAVAQVKVAVDPSGNVVALQNQGPLEVSFMSDVISTAVQASKRMFQQDAHAVQDNVKGGQSRVDATTLLQDQFQLR